jgi:hypothetical protein
MISSVRAAAPLGCVVLAALLTAGCNTGPRKVTVNGKVTRGGQAVTASNQGMVMLILVPQVAEGEHYTTYPANYNKEDGTFTIANVPVGKYRVELQILDPYPSNDLLKGAFSGATSPLVREITGDGPLEIDLDKPQG